MSKGRTPEFRYSTRSLEIQKLILAAAEAYRETNPAIEPVIIEIKRLMKERREYLVTSLMDRYGLEVPDKWLNEDNTDN